MQAGPAAAGIPLLAGSQSGALLPRHPLDVALSSFNYRHSVMVDALMEKMSQRIVIPVSLRWDDTITLTFASMTKLRNVTAESRQAGDAEGGLPIASLRAMGYLQRQDPLA